MSNANGLLMFAMRCGVVVGMACAVPGWGAESPDDSPPPAADLDGDPVEHAVDAGPAPAKATSPWSVGVAAGGIGVGLGVLPTVVAGAAGAATLGVVLTQASSGNSQWEGPANIAIVGFAVVGALAPVVGILGATGLAFLMTRDGWVTLFAALAGVAASVVGGAVGLVVGVPVGLGGTILGLLTLLQLGVIADSPGLGFLPLATTPPTAILVGCLGAGLGAGIAAGIAAGVSQAVITEVE